MGNCTIMQARRHFYLHVRPFWEANCQRDTTGVTLDATLKILGIRWRSGLTRQPVIGRR
jgi:hypothetical protein